MAEFMGERHHVARLTLVVQQHVRVRRGCGGVRESAWSLAGPHRRIDPAIGEKSLGDPCHLGRKSAIGRQHHVPGVWPADAAGGGKRQRRVAIPVRQFLLFKPACLQLVIAMRQPGIGGANRSNQRIDDFALHPVIEVARIRHILESAPAIGNLLVFCKRVGDQRKGPFVGLEGFRNRLRRRPAFFARAILQQSQGRLDRQLPAADLETQEMVCSNNLFQAA